MITEQNIDASKIISDLAEIGTEMYDYKKPIYKYTSIETAKIILETLSIRFRAPSTFNDPFEFDLDFFDTDLTNKEFKSMFEAGLRLNPQISSKKRKELIRKTNISDFKKSYKAVIEKQRHISMVFCASEINNNILMWSHYANCHKGVCLGIYMPPIISEIGCITRKVNYTDTIKPKRLYTSDQHQRFLALMYWIFTKAACWSYENEIRSFIINEANQLGINQEKSYYYLQLHESQLKEMYFGLKTSEKDINELKQVISKKGYIIPITKRMEKVRGAFALHVM
jgi:DUF2971 family protein